MTAQTALACNVLEYSEYISTHWAPATLAGAQAQVLDTPLTMASNFNLVQHMLSNY